MHSGLFEESMEATTHLSATVAWCGFALGLVFGAIVAGAAATMKYQYWKIMQEDTTPQPRQSGASSQADLDEQSQLVGEFDVAVVNRAHRNALPRLVAVDRLRGRGFSGQYAAEIRDCLFETFNRWHSAILRFQRLDCACCGLSCRR
jgi:hypothetical protein